MKSRADEPRSVWGRDLGARARRVLAIFGASKRDARKRRDDDDDDMPRPNAVATPLFALRTLAVA
jgi:hypothetical protein